MTSLLSARVICDWLTDEGFLTFNWLNESVDRYQINIKKQVKQAYIHFIWLKEMFNDTYCMLKKGQHQHRLIHSIVPQHILP